MFKKKFRSNNELNYLFKKKVKFTVSIFVLLFPLLTVLYKPSGISPVVLINFQYKFPYVLIHTLLLLLF